MTISNIQGIAFSNGKIRVLADLFAQTYATALALQNAWNAQGMGSIITNTSDVILDGSAVDGRPIITGAQATEIVVLAENFVTAYQANTNAQLNAVLEVAVNGQAAF